MSVASLVRMKLMTKVPFRSSAPAKSGYGRLTSAHCVPSKTRDPPLTVAIPSVRMRSVSSSKGRKNSPRER